MAKLREDVVHVAVRRFLRSANWHLVAGQYPNGSDDELPPLNIMDPILARDLSPDHRRHSKNKFVPDLVSMKNQYMLLVEMKPAFSISDQEKLEILLSDRKPHLLQAVHSLQVVRRVELFVPLEEIIFIPCLAFSASSKYQRRNDFCYFLVQTLDEVSFEGNAVLPKLHDTATTKNQNDI
jgi:hypothetical protein